MTASFPAGLTELTNEFLSKVLHQKVESYEVTRIGETTGHMSEVYRVKLIPDNEKLKSVVIKFATASGSGFVSEVYATELEFYKYLEKNNEIAGCNIPTCYYVNSTTKYDKFILQDYDEPYSVGNLKIDLKQSETEESLREIAKFHAHWWGKNETVQFEKLSPRLLSTFGSAVTSCWESGAKEKFEIEDALNDELEKAALFVGKYGKSIQVTPRTLCHGDFRSDNLLVWRGNDSSDLDADQRIISIIDFQIIHWGNPMEDVAYFISSGLSIDMVQNYKELLSIYHDALTKNGVSDYSLDDCIYDYKENIMYAIIMPVLSAMEKTKEENMTEKQKSDFVMTKLWRKRFSSAIFAAKSSDLIEELSEKFDKVFVGSPYPELDSGLASIVEFYQKSVPNWNSISVEERRATLDLVEKSANSRLPEKSEGVKSIHAISSSDLCPEVKVFVPDNPVSEKVIFYIYSCWIGGFGIGESFFRTTCEFSQDYVVAVNHRSSPEFKFSDLLLDCYHAFISIINDNERLMVPKTKQVSIIGDKQGAHLACCLVKLLIEKNQIEYVDKLVLLFPWLDPLCSSNLFSTIGNRFNSFVGKDICEFHWKHYCTSEQPLLFSDDALKQFPQTLILAAEFDVTREEAKNFAKKLKDLNVNSEYRMYEKVINLFYGSYFQTGKDACKFVVETINQ